MLPTVILVMFVQASPLHVRAEDLFTKANQIPRDLFYSAKGASGTTFCDESLKKRQTSRFDKRYGVRFNRLAEVIVARKGTGWEPDDIVVTSCQRWSAEQADRMLDKFEHDLRSYERRFGLRGNDR